ncbi:5'-nucleotidase [Gammaproteobacteria bacterium 45_16_T64]|nr:5'-nucleotidase [Gammaproteobacteria bacterium 45_16_T64]
MPANFNGKLVVATSSSALFNLHDSDAIFREQGLEAYKTHQIENEDQPLEPGDAFPLVKKLLALNNAKNHSPRVEVILLSRNSADTGLRVFNSIEHWGLPITRAAFCGGESPYRYISAFGSHLFLSSIPADVRQALDRGFAAAHIIAPSSPMEIRDELRIAFDGDAVIFSDESEKIFQEQGLQAFTDAERAAAKQPMEGGPFKPFLQVLHSIQQEYGEECPIRTALVTARSAPAHERVVRTLRKWNIRLDESLFLGGLDKGLFLKSFGADVFFDDQEGHCLSASKHVTAGHVAHGVTNTLKAN